MIQQFWSSLSFPIRRRTGCQFIASLMLVALLIAGLPTLSGAQQTCRPDGDVDQDGNVTIADALLVLQQAWNLTGLSACQLSIADVFPQPDTPDDAITNLDAACIFRKALNLPSCLDTLQSSNQPPIADAGPDQSVDAGVIVVLSGTESDPDGGIVSHMWEQTGGTTVSLAGADSLTAMFTAPVVSVDETLTFLLTVTDNDGAVGHATVSVMVTAIPPLPAPSPGP